MTRRLITFVLSIASLLAAPLAVPFSVFAQAVSSTATATSDKPIARPTVDYLNTRWYDFSTIQIRARYRFIKNSEGVIISDQIQYAPTVTGRIKFDSAAKYTLNFNLSSGGGFVSGWNATGIGKPNLPQLNFNIKQLYFSAKPMKGVEFQVGGLSFLRGVASEITTYDNDGYLVGERVDIKRPKKLFFDEVALTVGFIGDLKQPSAFPRLRREFGQTNYQAVLVVKSIGKRVIASEEFVNQWGVKTLHTGVALKVPESVAVDTLHVEFYNRLQSNSRGSGLAIWGEKALNKRFSVSGGYINIDPKYGGLNSDDYGKGQRLFAIGEIKLTTATSVQLFYTRAFGNSFLVSPGERFDVRLKFDIAKLLPGRKQS